MGAAASAQIGGNAWEAGNALDYQDNLFDERAAGEGFKPSHAKRGASNGNRPNKDVIPAQAFYAGEPSSFGEWLSQHQDFVEDAIRSSEKEGDEVNLKMKHLLQLLRGGAGMTDLPTQPFVVKSVRLVGQAEKDSVRLTEVEVEIELLKEGWVAVRLMPGFVALLSSSIDFSPAAADDNADGRDDDLRAGTTRVVGVVEKWYCLIASKPGIYKVRGSVLVPFLTARKTGFTAVIPQAASAQLEFSVPDAGVLIKCEPALETITERVEPQPADDTDDRAASGDSGGRTTVKCRLPPTSQFTVQWTEYLGTEQEKQDEGGLKAEISATTEQHCLASIGEGVLSLTNTFQYNITSGQISLFRVLIDPGVKVLSVDGMKNIRVDRWVVEPYGKSNDGASAAADATDDSAGSSKKSKKGKKGKTAKQSDKGGKEPVDSQKMLLSIWLEYGLEDEYNFTVVSEVEMGGTTARVKVPTFTTLIPSDHQEVVREKGFIAVVARTNVEIEEYDCAGALSPVDVSELPNKLSGAAGHSILHAYKFLQPQWNLELDVTKHADAEVLVAAADSAHYRVQVTAEGEVTYRMLLRVRNTQKQYLRVMIPEKAGGEPKKSRKDRRGKDADSDDDDDNNRSKKKKNKLSFEIYSAVVGGRTAKPSRDDKTGDVLIPLQKSEGSSGGGAFSVELLFLVEGGKKLEGRGFIDIAFAEVDLPINHFFASVFLPEGFKYGEFIGDLKEVQYFDGSPPSADAARAAAPQARHWGARNRRESLSYNAPASKSVSYKSKAKKSMPSSNRHGVIPVRVDISEEGEEFRFEQLLVSEQQLSLEVEYLEKEKKKNRNKK